MRFQMFIQRLGYQDLDGAWFFDLRCRTINQRLEHPGVRKLTAWLLLVSPLRGWGWRPWLWMRIAIPAMRRRICT